MNSYYPVADEQNCHGETTNSETPLLREPTVRREDLSRELQGESGESQPADTADDAEALADFWSIQGDFIYRHHNEPRVRLYVPRKKHSPFH